MNRLPSPVFALPVYWGALALLLAGQPAGAASNIVRDGSVGSGPATALLPSGTVTRNAVTYNLISIPESYGRRAGSNLFQSFSSFSVGNGDGALFTLAAPASNVIARVSGGSATTINGLLGVDPGSTGSAPNLFFINPAGVTFGAGSAIDVPGAFHVSTADYIKFADGKFYASTAQTSTFSSAAPEAFGFLGGSHGWVSVIEGAALTTAAQPIDIVAGSVYMDAGTIASGGGEVRVVALGTPAAPMEVGLSGALPVARGDLAVLNGSLIDGSAPGALNGGDVRIAAGAVVIDASAIRSTAGVGTTGNAGSVTVQAAGDMLVSGGSSISSDTWSSGHAGSVTVSAKNLVVEQSGISSDSVGEGNAGSVNVAVAEMLAVVRGSISSDTWVDGNAGNLSVTAGSLLIDGQGSIAKISSESFGTGKAGSVDINVTREMVIVDRGRVSSDSINSGVAGQAGDVSVTAGSLIIDGYGVSAYISSDAVGVGNAGSVSINVSGAMALYNGAAISSDSYASGQEGKVVIRAGSLILDTDAKISSEARSDGNAGSIDVQVTGAASLLHRSQISSNALGFGDAGSVTVRAASLALDDESKISSDSTGVGNGGPVDVRVGGDLSILNNSAISSSATSFGDAGSVTVRAGALVLDDGDILSEARGDGNAGSLDVVVSGPMRLSNGALVSSNTFAFGLGGAVAVTADSLTVEGNSQISSDARSSGDAGSVTVRVAGSLNVLDRAQISSDSYSFGNAGNVTVIAGSLNADGFGNATYISSDALGGGDAGSVSVQVAGAMRVANRASVSSDTYSFGHAGNVTVHAGSLVVDGRDGLTFISSDALGDGDAGTVSVRVDGAMAVVNGGSVSSDTYSFGRAGNVDVDVGSLRVAGAGSTISSKAREFSSGQTGTVSVRAGSEILLSDGASLSIANEAWAFDPSLLTRTQLTVTAPSIVLRNASITADSSGNVPASNITVNAGSLVLDGHDGTTFISSDALADGDAGSVSVRVEGAMSVLSGGGVSSNSHSVGRAGNVTVHAGSLVVDGRDGIAGISSDTSGDGDAGSVSVQVDGAMSVRNGGFVSSDTFGAGRAGNVRVEVGSLEVDGPGSTISSKAWAFSSGQTGTVSVSAADRIALADGATLSIANEAVVLDPSLLTPTRLTVTAPLIELRDASITAASTGNVAASDIVVNVGKFLFLDPSSISTSSVDGDGGSISILGPNAFVMLENSQITTSVSGLLNGNGGDITIQALGLVLNTGFIQANTAAASASGGNVNIDVQLLIPSGNSLFLGGSTVLPFLPGVFGYNVIQAAAPDGVSGTIAVTAPVLDISGSLTGLTARSINTGELGRSPCRLGAGSSLVQSGRGGFAPAARDFLGADGGGEPVAAPQRQGLIRPVPLAMVAARCSS